MVLDLPGGLFEQRDVRETPSASATASSTIIAPIGTIMAWLKSYTNTPQTLPTGWVECDGAILSDADSVYDGQVIPNLNGNNNFVRGNSTSGGTGGSSTHTLTLTEIPAHSHNVIVNISSGSSNGVVKEIGDAAGQAPSTTMSQGGGGAHENKPPYYNVVWIIRVK